MMDEQQIKQRTKDRRPAVRLHREKARLRHQRQRQCGGKTLQFQQAVGLALRGALRQRQTAGDRKHLRQIDGQDPHTGA